MKNMLVYIPFSSPWIIRHHLGNARTVLDVGCGDGEFMLKVNPDKKYDVVGLDLYKPDLKKAKKTGVYKKVIFSDLRKIKLLRKVRFKNNSFDVVLASQVIEHISKKEGLKVISTLEKLAKRKVIIFTPNGFVPFDPFDVIDDNPLQVHKSGWEIEEMRRYGYKVYGQANSFIYRPQTGLLYKFRKLKNFFVIISLLLAPISYFLPKTSSMIIAVKEK